MSLRALATAPPESAPHSVKPLRSSRTFTMIDAQTGRGPDVLGKLE